MANEIKVFGGLSFAKNDRAEAMETPGVLSLTMSGSKFIHHEQTIGTVQEALVLGEATAAGGWCFIYNRSALNFVSIKASSSAAALIQIGPREPALFRFHNAATTPFAQADTNPCDIEYLIISP